MKRRQDQMALQSRVSNSWIFSNLGSISRGWEGGWREADGVGGVGPVCQSGAGVSIIWRVQVFVWLTDWGDPDLIRPLCFFLCFRWARALDLGRALQKKHVFFTAQQAHFCRFSTKNSYFREIQKKNPAMFFFLFFLTSFKISIFFISSPSISFLRFVQCFFYWSPSITFQK